MKHICRSWHQAADLYHRSARRPKHGGPPRVNLGYATWLHQRWPDGVHEGDPSYAVRFHATDVVTYRPDGSIEIVTDGWFTVTTKSRIEDYTPAEVWVRTANIPRGSRPVEFVVCVGRGEGKFEFDMVRDYRAIIAPALLGR